MNFLYLSVLYQELFIIDELLRQAILTRTDKFMNMRKEEIFKRYLLFIIGLFVNSLGICFIIKADLGSSPISSLPYTISLKSPISLGTLTFILNLFLIAGQMLILKKDFKQREWLQLPISVLFGVFIDLSMWMIG